MGARRRLTPLAGRGGFVAALALLAGLALGGLAACSSCKHKEDAPSGQAKPPPDHLAPTELAEGGERAFGLPLPRLSRVTARFPTTVDVQSPLAPDELLQFVRARVTGGKATPTATGTELAGVTPTAAPQQRLSIHVRPFSTGDGTRSELVVRDVTPAPVEPGLTDEQRWKKAGLTPDGKIADPARLE